mmetsp:Transcript_24771/g.40172  ORF Transcript_24771/g.40172 Transcript_24771/m.40172 type:complete len:352 (+) Transcript_24771:120-1175(+)
MAKGWEEESSEDDDDAPVLADAGDASTVKSETLSRDVAQDGDGDQGEFVEEEESIFMDPSGQDEEDGDDTQVNVDFDFCDPKDENFHMVKALFEQGSTCCIPGMLGGLSSLSEDICGQAAVGTTVCVDEQVFCFVSALCESYYGSKGYFKTFKSLLTTFCPQNMKAKMDDALKRGYAWLISERLVNIPHEIAAPLHEALVDDIKWARENIEETGGSKEMFEFENFVFIAPCYIGQDKTAVLAKEQDAEMDSDEEEEEEEQKPPKKKSKRAVDHSDDGKPLFVHFEDEIFIKHSIVSFQCKLNTEIVIQDKAKGAVPQRHKPKHAIVGIISKKEHSECIKRIQAYIEGSQNL